MISVTQILVTGKLRELLIFVYASPRVPSAELLKTNLDYFNNQIVAKLGR